MKILQCVHDHNTLLISLRKIADLRFQNIVTNLLQPKAEMIVCGLSGVNEERLLTRPDLFQPDNAVDLDTFSIFIISWSSYPILEG